MMDETQVPRAPAQALDPPPAQWRRFARRFVVVFITELIAVFIFGLFFFVVDWIFGLGLTTLLTKLGGLSQ